MDVEKLECEDELTGTEISCLRLKGQMIYLPEADSILFLCSPRYFKPSSSIIKRFSFYILILRIPVRKVPQRLIGSNIDFIDFDVFTLKGGGAFKHQNLTDY